MQAATEFQSYETSIAAAALIYLMKKCSRLELDFLNAYRLTGTWKRGQPMQKAGWKVSTFNSLRTLGTKLLTKSFNWAKNHGFEANKN
jgi:hypothetical protein